jgi:hypothetical protein
VVGNPYFGIISGLAHRSGGISAIVSGKLRRKVESTPFTAEISFRHVDAEKTGLWEEPNPKVPSE